MKFQIPGIIQTLTLSPPTRGRGLKLGEGKTENTEASRRPPRGGVG